MQRIQLTLGRATVAKYSIKGIIRNKTRGCGGGLTHTLRDTCENNNFHYYQASARHTSGAGGGGWMDACSWGLELPSTASVG